MDYKRHRYKSPDPARLSKILRNPWSQSQGGCSFFVAENIFFNPRPDLDISHFDKNSEFEANWIEVSNQKDKNFLVDVIYRHPRTKMIMSF